LVEEAKARVDRSAVSGRAQAPEPEAHRLLAAAQGQRQVALPGNVQPRAVLHWQNRQRNGEGARGLLSCPLQRRAHWSRTGRLPAPTRGEPSEHRDLHRHLLAQAPQAQAHAGRRAPAGCSRLLPLRSFQSRRERLCHGPLYRIADGGKSQGNRRRAPGRGGDGTRPAHRQAYLRNRLK